MTKPSLRWAKPILGMVGQAHHKWSGQLQEPGQLQGRYILGLFLIALAVRGLYYGLVGTHEAGDSSFYEQIASEMLRLGPWRPIEVLQVSHIGFFHLKPLYPMFLAANLAVRGSISPDLIAWEQIFIDACGSVLVAYIVAKTVSVRAGLVAGLGHALLWETFRWTTYVLTETTYLFLILVFVAMWVYLQERRTPLAVGLALLALLLVHLTRPTGVVFVLLLAGWSFFQSVHPRPFRSAYLMMAIGALLVVMLPALVPRDTTIAKTFPLDALESSGAVLRNAAQVVRDETDSGLSFTDDQGFGPMILERPWDYLRLAGRKVIALYAIYFDEFSLAHRVLNIVSLSPLYVLAVVGSLAGRHRSIVQLSLLGVAGFTLFHVITWVDYDQRYRAPILMFLILLAATGVEELWRLISRWPWLGDRS